MHTDAAYYLLVQSGNIAVVAQKFTNLMALINKLPTDGIALIEKNASKLSHGHK